jgi:hypothetical protein
MDPVDAGTRAAVAPIRRITLRRDPTSAARIVYVVGINSATRATSGPVCGTKSDASCTCNTCSVASLHRRKVHSERRVVTIPLISDVWQPPIFREPLGRSLKSSRLAESLPSMVTLEREQAILASYLLPAELTTTLLRFAGNPDEHVSIPFYGGPRTSALWHPTNVVDRPVMAGSVATPIARKEIKQRMCRCLRPRLAPRRRVSVLHG